MSDFVHEGYYLIGPESDIVINIEWLLSSLYPENDLTKFAYVKAITKELYFVFLQVSIGDETIRAIFQYTNYDMAHNFAEDFAEHYVPTKEFLEYAAS